MSGPTRPLLSVRGDARQSVAPDYVILASTIAVSRGSKREAVGTAASALERLIADLTSFGGVALEVETGLLGGGDSERYRLLGGAASMTSLSGGGESDIPSLDPVPQQLTAAIEARFTATGVSLTER